MELLNVFGSNPSFYDDACLPENNLLDIYLEHSDGIRSLIRNEKYRIEGEINSKLLGDTMGILTKVLAF